MPAQSRLLAVELNPCFVRTLRRIRDARLSAVEGDALGLARHMSRRGLGRADAVVSGVPLSLLGERTRRKLLTAVRGALKPGGRFVVYQLTPQLAPLLKEGFQDVEVSFELRNLPPLFVLSCRR
jgi:phospholipid N-methyltransferase